MPAVCDQANFEPARQKRLVAGRTAGQQDERGTMSVMPCAIIRTDVAFDPRDVPTPRFFAQHRLRVPDGFGDDPSA